MAKNFKITVNSPVEIVGGFTINSGMVVYARINNVDESPTDHDLISYDFRSYVSEVAKGNGEPEIMPKGMVIKKQRPQGEMFVKVKAYVKSTDIVYATKITAGKRKFTASSLTSQGDNLKEVIAGLLGKNANDLSVE